VVALVHKQIHAAATIARMAEHFETLLRNVVAQPDVKLNQLIEIFNDANWQQQLAMEQEYQNTVSQKLINIKRKSHRKSKRDEKPRTPKNRASET